LIASIFFNSFRTITYSFIGSSRYSSIIIEKYVLGDAVSDVVSDHDSDVSGDGDDSDADSVNFNSEYSQEGAVHRLL
jgi:hypothetical protein